MYVYIYCLLAFIAWYQSWKQDPKWLDPGFWPTHLKRTGTGVWWVLVNIIWHNQGHEGNRVAWTYVSGGTNASPHCCKRARAPALSESRTSLADASALTVRGGLMIYWWYTIWIYPCLDMPGNGKSPSSIKFPTWKLGLLQMSWIFLRHAGFLTVDCRHCRPKFTCHF